MFLLLGTEEVRAGEAFSTVFTFEENGRKRFPGLCLGYRKNFPKGMRRKKMKACLEQECLVWSEICLGALSGHWCGHI